MTDAVRGYSGERPALPQVCSDQAGAAVLRNGAACVLLDPPAAALLAAAQREAAAFFDLPAERKTRHSSADENFGFRRMGKEYSISPDRPDVNDCFTLWSDRLDLIPHADEIPQLLRALSALRDAFGPLVRGCLEQIARAMDVPADLVPPFLSASHLQVNDYRTVVADREFLQEQHEDGHLLTLLHAQKPGLELMLGDACLPVCTAADEVLVLPGSVLTAITAGRVPPAEHQVRNHRLPHRQSLMYFVNPELGWRLPPWTGDEAGDLCDVVRARPQAFGLPEVPLL